MLIIENAVNPKLLLLMERYNRRVILQYACGRYTRKRKEELKTGKLGWLDLLFELYPYKGKKPYNLTDYFAIAMAHLLTIKSRFMKNKDENVTGWYDGHHDAMLIGRDFFPFIKNRFFEIKYSSFKLKWEPSKEHCPTFGANFVFHGKDIFLSVSMITEYQAMVSLKAGKGKTDHEFIKDTSPEFSGSYSYLEKLQAGIEKAVIKCFAGNSLALPALISNLVSLE